MRAEEPSHARLRRPGRWRYKGALTLRQQAVFDLLATGLTNEEIAQHLGITPYGVKCHVAEILQRLGVENRHDAVALHLRTKSNGWLAAWAPVMFLRKLPLAWISKAAAGGALTATAAGIALLAWGGMSTATATVTTNGCGVEQTVGGAPPCAPGVAQAVGGVGAISASGHHTCALKDGGVWCWGNYANGALGNNSTAIDSPVPVAVSGLAGGVTAISASGGAPFTNGSHICAVKGGGAWCVGDNTFGELGNNSRTPSNVPVAVVSLASGVSAITTSGGRTCALQDGGAWCWGLGEPGPGTPYSQVPVSVLRLTSGVTAISAGSAQTCAVKDGGVWCWGSNLELANNRTVDSSVPVPVAGLASGVSAISTAGDHSCALKDDGVWCWGRNAYGQLGNDSTTDSQAPVAVSGLTSGVSAISVGVAHACALKGGGVWCWGANGDGRLGNNGTADSHVPVAVSGLASGVTAISAASGSFLTAFAVASGHTCALKDGGFWCWGSNQLGQLGNNSTADSSVPVRVLFTPELAPGGQPLPVEPSTDSTDYRAAYVLAGIAAALAIVVAGGRAVWRRFGRR